MTFKLFTTLLVAVSTILSVNAVPSPILDAKPDFAVLKRHDINNALEARYAKHRAHVARDVLSRQQQKNRSLHRKQRRSCPVSSTLALSVPTTTTPQEDVNNNAEQTPAVDSYTPVDPPAPSDPAPSDESGSSNDNGSSSTTNTGDVQAYLDAHNGERAKHGADALTWADDLASVAQAWVNNCQWKHSGGQYGENLSTGTGMTPTGAVQLWLNEASEYDPSNPTYSHWTQVVWKGSKEVGCAVATCSSESMFGTDAYGSALFYACEYRPAGNIIGQFAENVQA